MYLSTKLMRLFVDGINGRKTKAVCLAEASGAPT